MQAGTLTSVGGSAINERGIMYYQEPPLNELRSKCCGADVDVAGNVTKFYYCTACRAPCDVEAISPRHSPRTESAAQIA
jgi:hypothetical protein